jgi:protein-S-isoprenylcysteine O-methyltransferase Ste14
MSRPVPASVRAGSRARAERDRGVITVLRHLASILLLPFVVTAAVPFWLLTSDHFMDCRWQRELLVYGGRASGLLVFGAGFLLFAWCIHLFARTGQGTLAPWDPTQRLVSSGPYRRVRNPMIAGVAGMLAGEALFFGSAALAGWCSLFVAINHVYLVVSEEPGLRRRFGAAYVEYARRVPRWLPEIRRLAARPGAR